MDDIFILSVIQLSTGSRSVIFVSQLGLMGTGAVTGHLATGVSEGQGQQRSSRNRDMSCENCMVGFSIFKRKVSVNVSSLIANRSQWCILHSW